jgi:hypothetical protein
VTGPAMTTVRVRNRAAEAPHWGHGLLRVCVDTVEIPDACLTCGGPRGETGGLNQCDDGAYYNVNVWQNPCGHVDSYPMVLAIVATGQGRRLRREWL